PERRHPRRSTTNRTSSKASASRPQFSLAPRSSLRNAADSTAPDSGVQSLALDIRDSVYQVTVLPGVDSSATAIWLRTGSGDYLDHTTKHAKPEKRCRVLAGREKSTALRGSCWRHPVRSWWHLRGVCQRRRASRTEAEEW